jgi:hypothetical protein
MIILRERLVTIIAFGLAVEAIPNTTVVRTKIAGDLCPFDLAPDGTFSIDDGSANVLATPALTRDAACMVGTRDCSEVVSTAEN